MPSACAMHSALSGTPWPPPGTTGRAHSVKGFNADPCRDCRRTMLPITVRARVDRRREAQTALLGAVRNWLRAPRPPRHLGYQAFSRATPLRLPPSTSAAHRRSVVDRRRLPRISLGAHKKKCDRHVLARPVLLRRHRARRVYTGPSARGMWKPHADDARRVSRRQRDDSRGRSQ